MTDDIHSELENLRNHPRATVSVRQDYHDEISDIAANLGCKIGEVADRLVNYALVHYNRKINK